MFMHVGQNEGLMALQKGIVPSLLRETSCEAAIAPSAAGSRARVDRRRPTQPGPCPASRLPSPPLELLTAYCPHGRIDTA